MDDQPIRLKPSANPGRFDFQAAILYEDADILCINKPAGYSSLGERHEITPSLLALVRQHRPTARLCHRLDKHTTGAMLFSLQDAAYRTIALAFQHREVLKVYHALIEGIHNIDYREIDFPLTPIIKGVVRVDFEAGKKAFTIVKTERTFGHYTLLACMPMTGRSHQIRVHLATLRMPLVGDNLYGGRNMFLSRLKRRYKHKAEIAEQPLNDGYMLHAVGLRFRHPTTGEMLSIEAPYAKNFTACLRLLEKYDPALV